MVDNDFTKSCYDRSLMMMHYIIYVYIHNGDNLSQVT